jgi:hypothetical protein
LGSGNRAARRRANGLVRANADNSQTIAARLVYTVGAITVTETDSMTG